MWDSNGRNLDRTGLSDGGVADVYAAAAGGVIGFVLIRGLVTEHLAIVTLPR